MRKLSKTMVKYRYPFTILYLLDCKEKGVMTQTVHHYTFFSTLFRFTFVFILLFFCFHITSLTFLCSYIQFLKTSSWYLWKEIKQLRYFSNNFSSLSSYTLLLNESFTQRLAQWFLSASIIIVSYIYICKS